MGNFPRRIHTHVERFGIEGLPKKGDKDGLEKVCATLFAESDCIVCVAKSATTMPFVRDIRIVITSTAFALKLFTVWGSKTKPENPSRRWSWSCISLWARTHVSVKSRDKERRCPRFTGSLITLLILRSVYTVPLSLSPSLSLSLSLSFSRGVFREGNSNRSQLKIHGWAQVFMKSDRFSETVCIDISDRLRVRKREMVYFESWEVATARSIVKIFIDTLKKHERLVFSS